MNAVITAFAVISVVLTAVIFYYNVKIVARFREDEELTATKLVIKEQVPDAFMALSIASLFFSLGTFLGASFMIIEIDYFSYFSEIGVVTMLVGLLTFMKRIENSVSEGEKNEVESETGTTTEDEEKASEDKDNSDEENEEDEEKEDKGE